MYCGSDLITVDTADLDYAMIWKAFYTLLSGQGS